MEEAEKQFVGHFVSSDHRVKPGDNGMADRRVKFADDGMADRRVEFADDGARSGAVVIRLAQVS